MTSERLRLLTDVCANSVSYPTSQLLILFALLFFLPFSNELVLLIFLSYPFLCAGAARWRVSGSAWLRYVRTRAEQVSSRVCCACTKCLLWCALVFMCVSVCVRMRAICMCACVCVCECNYISFSLLYFSYFPIAQALPEGVVPLDRARIHRRRPRAMDSRWPH